MIFEEPSQDIDDILLDEKSADFDADDIDHDLFDGEDLLSVDNSSDINNIFPFPSLSQTKLFGIVWNILSTSMPINFPFIFITSLYIHLIIFILYCQEVLIYFIE